MSRDRSLERRLRRIYSQASKELTEKVDSFFAKFDELDKKKLALVNAGKLSEEEYKTWRKNKLLVGNDYKALRDNVADRMLNANKIAASYINGEVAGSYTKGYNRVGRDAERAVAGYSFSMINEATVKRLATDKKTLLPYKFVDGRKDTRWNTKKVNAAILQGVIQGEPSKKIAERLMRVTEMNKESAIRNARTALTSASNHGRQDAMKRLQDDGAIVEKEWLASVGDGRTREAHLELHHVSVPIDKPFVNSIGEIMFPGDPNADPANVYNCRCSIATKIIGFRKKDAPESEAPEADNESSYSVSDLIKPQRPRRSDFEDEDAYYAARDKYRAERDAFDKRLDEVVEKALENPRFENREDFMTWANDRNIHVSDDFADKIDLRTMSETSKTLDELFERFPEAKSFEFFDFDGTRVEPGFSLMADDDGFMSCRGGIAFNPNVFNNFENALRESLDSAMSGNTVMGDGTFSTMIRHEYGHQVEGYIKIHVIGRDGIQGLDDWRGHFPSLEAYRSACKECADLNEKYTSELRKLFNLPGASEYSNQDLRELFAEGFAEWSSGGKTEFAKAFGEFFGRWYK